MTTHNQAAWMWEETLALLERADRLHRQFFQPSSHHGVCPCWEPPIDIFEAEDQFLIVAALPGVASEQLEIDLRDTILVIRGQRFIPDAIKNAVVRRIEIPFGRFERTIQLPAAGYRVDRLTFKDGCLSLVMRLAT